MFIAPGNLNASTNSNVTSEVLVDELGEHIVKKVEYIDGEADKEYIYTNNVLTEESKYKLMTTDYESTIYFEDVSGESIKKSKIQYNTDGNVIDEVFYNSSGEIYKQDIYDTDSYMVRSHEIKDGEIIRTKKVPNVSEQKYNDKIEEERLLKAKEDEMNSYVEIEEEKISFTDEGIEKMVDEQIEDVVTDVEKDIAKDSIIENINEINNDIKKGDAEISKNGRVKKGRTQEVLTRGGKNKGPKRYWWGVRTWYSTAKAKKTAKVNLRAGIAIKGSGAVASGLSFVAVHPVVAGFAKATGLGFGYVGTQFTTMGKVMNAANSRHKKGIILDINWVLNSNAYRQ